MNTMMGRNRISLFVILSLYGCLYGSAERYSPRTMSTMTIQTNTINNVRGGDADEAVQEDDESSSSTAPTVESENADDDDEEESQVAAAAAEEAPDSATEEGEEEELSETEAETETETEEATVDSAAIEAARAEATELRLKGKELHDQGDFEKAAELFQKAADAIQATTTTATTANGGSSNTVIIVTGEASEEYVTCRLHQALCHLKSEDYESCIDACTNVLGEETNPTTYSPAVRARAYHRRAKAKQALEDPSGALQDARSAAFLGDRRAVAFYGKLMRESSPFTGGGGDSSLSSSSSSNAALLESLLGKSSSSSSSSGNSGMPDFNPASLLLGNSGNNNNMLSALGGGGGKGAGGLAKSVMESMYKRLDDEATQTKISSMLQSANKQQLQQLAGMAGVSHVIQDSHLDKILKICHGVTPKAIRRTVKTSKRAVYGVKLVRRVLKIIRKYKTFLIAIALLQWSKSACLRPLPTDRKAAKRAAKLALKEAMKHNRTP